MSELLDLGLFPLDRTLEHEALEDYIALQTKSCVYLFVEKDWKSRS